MHNILRRMTTRLCAMWGLHKSNMYSFIIADMPCQSRCLASYGTIYYYNAMLYFYVCVFFLCFLPNFQCNVIFHSFSPFLFILLSLLLNFFLSGLLLFVSHESSALSIYFWYIILYGQFFFLFTFNLVVYLQHKKKIVPFFLSRH